MALTYIFREDPNFKQNVSIIAGNHSIDAVINKVQYLAGDINDIVRNVDKTISQLSAKGSETVDNVGGYVRTLSSSANGVAEVATDKFGDFPIDLFLAVLILAFLVIIIALCYFISVGSMYAIEYRQTAKLEAEIREI
uniref:t-SNARE coiled-coil homology domain-containing protein n=1 Tax=Panagrellus redivivus TaxID=6233 RepID=A0A7E4W2Y9_PANRE